MGDDITIGVTEIVNNIEVTAQPNDQQIDISVIDNADEVTLNVTPTVVEVNINRGSSYARWGTIYGTLGDQTDLANALLLKADLVGGLVPAYQLPSYVDDVVEVANYAALPTVGETGKIYITLDNNKIYRWSGSVYIEIASNNAVWGAITGTLSSQTDLQSALNAKANISGQVFTGAISATNLSGTNTGDQDLSGLVPNTRTLTINGTSYDLSANRSWTISAGISGSGTTGKIPLFTGSTAIGDSSLTEYSYYLNLTKPLTIAYSTATSGTALNLSLNNSSSTGTTLYVYNAGTGNLMQLQKSNNTPALVVDASGYVGIGVGTPNTPLDVVSNVSARSLNIRNRSADDLGNIIFLQMMVQQIMQLLVGLQVD